MKKTLYDYNDQHIGETIYILGSSPALNDLNEEDLEFLKDKITIGVNLTYEGINTLTYAISAHIANAVYLFEHSKKDMPIFVAFNEGQKREAFSHMKHFFWDDERVVVFSSDPPRLPLLQKHNTEDISLSGNTSVLLLATHLAYIMGASKIVYIGFEELKCAHFWNSNRQLEIRMVNNIKNILKSKKYWSELFYNNNLWDIHHNVHKEFELMLGCIPGHASCFNLSEEEREKSFWGATGHNIGTPPAIQNIYNFANYIKYLKYKGVDAYTLSHQGITINSGCISISDMI